MALSGKKKKERFVLYAAYSVQNPTKLPAFKSQPTRCTAPPLFSLSCFHLFLALTHLCEANLIFNQQN